MYFMNVTNLIIKQSLFYVFVSMLISGCGYYSEYSDDLSFEIEENTKFIKLGSEENASKGIIMYPGALVDPWAYVSLFDKVVEKDILIIIARFPSDLAVLDIDAASWLLKEFDEISDWTIIGHSLGGAMACSYVANNPGIFSNLIILGSYPGKSTDLSAYEGLFLSIYGSKDAFTTLEDIEESRSRVNNPKDYPTDTDQLSSSNVSYFYEILGGNHSYFASYGLQSGDNEADITADIQLQRVKELISEIMKL